MSSRESLSLILESLESKLSIKISKLNRNKSMIRTPNRLMYVYVLTWYFKDFHQRVVLMMTIKISCSILGLYLKSMYVLLLNCIC
jgi:hypothetical protein